MARAAGRAAARPLRRCWPRARPACRAARGPSRLRRVAGGRRTGDSGELWAREAGRGAHEFVSELAGRGDAAGKVPTRAYPALLAVLMGDALGAAAPGRASAPRHPGPAREPAGPGRPGPDRRAERGRSPPAVDAGPWLNRAMRKQLGLPPVEQAIGFAAHDFLTSRLRARGGAEPGRQGRARGADHALALAGAAAGGARPRPAAAAGRGAGPQWADWADGLDAAAGPTRGRRPARAAPAAAARPRELWATDVERLMRDPYAVYARRILSWRRWSRSMPIRAVRSAGRSSMPRCEEFVRALAGPAARRPAHRADRGSGARHFALQAHRPQVWAVWWPRFERIAAWFCEVEQRRRARGRPDRHRDPRHAVARRRPAARSASARAPTGSRSAATAAWASSTTRPAPCPAARTSPTACRRS